MSGKIMVYYRETKTVCLDQDVEIKEETPEGITVRHTYRKTGKRLEFIPRDKLEGIIYEDVKTPRNTRKAKEVAPIPKPVAEPVKEKPVVPAEDTGDSGIFSEDEDFDDSGDDFDDDDFE